MMKILYEDLLAEMQAYDGPYKARVAELMSPIANALKHIDFGDFNNTGFISKLLFEATENFWPLTWLSRDMGRGT